ncbi:MAG: hypothetical protein N2560_02475 [Ignavibacteria bacterium]|nr:hypothetical protein [Ignavibacteria bacterium]
MWVYNTHFINNIFTDSSYQLDVDGNNRLLGNVYLPLEKIFQNYDKSEIDRYKHDFHLKTEAKQKIKGTDGTDIGIYGTREPFKEYGLPVNPQIKKAKVSPMTTPDGKLKIEFEVEAQEKKEEK